MKTSCSSVQGQRYAQSGAAAAISAGTEATDNISYVSRHAVLVFPNYTAAVSPSIPLRAETDTETWTTFPLKEDGAAFNEIADWGPVEDWSDWADAAG